MYNNKNKLSKSTTTTQIPIHNLQHIHKKQLFSKKILEDFQIYKDLYYTRRNQRHSALSFLMQGALVIGLKEAEKGLKLSQSLKELDYNIDFVEYINSKLLFRTSKYMEEIQYMFDILLLCRFYQKSKKTQGIVYLISNIMVFPKAQDKLDFQCQFNKKLTNKQQIRELNSVRQQISKYESILKSLILITSQQQLLKTTLFLYKQLIKIVKSYEGNLELATLYFQIGNFFFKSKDFHSKSCEKNPESTQQYTPKQKVAQAKQYFEMSKKIRQACGQSLPLADTLTNLGLIQYYYQNCKSAIQHLKDSLRMKKDVLGKVTLDMCLQLQTLGKWHLMQGQFSEGYKRLVQCLQLRLKYFVKGDKVHEKQLRRVQVLMIFFFRSLKNALFYEYEKEQKKKKLEILIKLQNEIFIKQNFKRYKIYDKQQLNHLQLNFNQQIFHLLPLEFIQKFRFIQNQLKQLTFIEGLKFINQFQPFQKLANKTKSRIQQFLNSKICQFYSFMNTEQLNHILQINK